MVRVGTFCHAIGCIKCDKLQSMDYLLNTMFPIRRSLCSAVIDWALLNTTTDCIVAIIPIVPSGFVAGETQSHREDESRACQSDMPLIHSLIPSIPLHTSPASRIQMHK
jgi:hypothetical protein